MQCRLDLGLSGAIAVRRSECFWSFGELMLGCYRGTGDIKIGQVSRRRTFGLLDLRRRAYEKAGRIRKFPSQSREEKSIPSVLKKVYFRIVR